MMSTFTPKQKASMLILAPLGSLTTLLPPFLWGRGIGGWWLVLIPIVTALACALWLGVRRWRSAREGGSSSEDRAKTKVKTWRPALGDRRPRLIVLGRSEEEMGELLRGWGARPYGGDIEGEDTSEHRWWAGPKGLYLPVEWGVDSGLRPGWEGYLPRRWALGGAALDGLIAVAEVGAGWGAAEGGAALGQGLVGACQSVALGLGYAPAISLCIKGCQRLEGYDVALGVLGAGALTPRRGALISRGDFEAWGERLGQVLASTGTLRLPAKDQAAALSLPPRVRALGVGLGAFFEEVQAWEDASFFGGFVDVGASHPGDFGFRGRGRRGASLALLALCFALAGVGGAWLDGQARGALAWGMELREGVASLNGDVSEAAQLSRGEVLAGHEVLDTLARKPWLPQADATSERGKIALRQWTDSRLILPLAGAFTSTLKAGGRLDLDASTREGALALGRAYRGVMALDELASTATSAKKMEPWVGGYLAGLWADAWRPSIAGALPEAALKALLDAYLKGEGPSDIAKLPEVADAAQVVRDRLSSEGRRRSPGSDILTLVMAMIDRGGVEPHRPLGESLWGDPGLWVGFTPSGCLELFGAPFPASSTAYITLAKDARLDWLMSLEAMPPFEGLEDATLVLRALSHPEDSPLLTLLGALGAGPAPEGDEEARPEVCDELAHSLGALGGLSLEGGEVPEALKLYQAQLSILADALNKVVLSAGGGERALQLLRLTLEDGGPLYELRIARSALIAALGEGSPEAALRHLDGLLAALEGDIYGHLMAQGLPALQMRWKEDIQRPYAHLRARGRAQEPWESCPEVQAFLGEELQTFLGEEVAPLLSQGGSLSRCEPKALYGQPIPLNPEICRQGGRALRVAGSCPCPKACDEPKGLEVVGLRGESGQCSQDVATLRFDTGEVVLEWQNATDQMSVSSRASRGKPQLYVAMSRDPGGRGRFVAPSRSDGGSAPRDLEAFLALGEGRPGGVYRFEGARGDSCPGGVSVEIEVKGGGAPCGGGPSCQWGGISLPRSLWE